MILASRVVVSSSEHGGVLPGGQLITFGMADPLLPLGSDNTFIGVEVIDIVATVPLA
jgi:hypothetical protein